jgi:hypothetical protein
MQAPGAGFYTVTVTGVVGGMLPPKPGDLLMNTSPVYAQIFINHNGQCRIAFFVLIVKDSVVLFKYISFQLHVQFYILYCTVLTPSIAYVHRYLETLQRNTMTSVKKQQKLVS